MTGFDEGKGESMATYQPPTQVGDSQSSKNGDEEENKGKSLGAE